MHGYSQNEELFIPRIAFIPSDTTLPLQMKRQQFPIKPVMSINKSLYLIK